MKTHVERVAYQHSDQFQEAIETLDLKHEAGGVADRLKEYLCSGTRALNRQEAEVVFKQLAAHFSKLSIDDTRRIIQEVRLKKEGL